MTQYPHDHFDDVPAYTDRRGSHRAQAVPPVKRSNGLLWIIVAAVVALAVGLFSFFVLPSLAGNSGPQAGGGTSISATASATGAASASEPAASADEGSDEAASTESAEASESVTSEPAPETTLAEESEPATSEPAEPEPSEPETSEAADPNAAVEVYNASRVNGLAGRVSSQLSGAGFTVTGTGNWQGFGVDSSAVYFSSDEATAVAVATELGVLAHYDERVPGITVVLAADYAG